MYVQIQCTSTCHFVYVCSYEKKNDILIRSLCCTCIIYHSSEFMTTYFFFKGGVIPSQDRGKNQDSRGTQALVGG